MFCDQLGRVCWIFFVNFVRFDFLYLNSVHIITYKKYTFIYYEKYNNKQEKINKKVLNTMTLQTKKLLFYNKFFGTQPQTKLEDQILIKITEWD